MLDCDLDDSQFSSPSPSPSPTLTTQDYTAAYSQSDPSSYYDPSSGYYSDSNHSATPDIFPSLNSDFQYMTSPKHNPPIHIQESESAPHHLSQFPSNTPSPMLDESTLSPTSWEQLRDLSRFSPRGHRQQLGHLGQRRYHKRLSSGSSVGSAGPDSPYTQTSSSNPRIVDLDSSSASSPHLESLDIGNAGVGHVSKPLFPVSSSSSQQNFLAPIFQNYNPSSCDADNMMVQEAMNEAVAELRRPEMDGQLASASRGSFGSPYDALDDQRSRLLLESQIMIPKLNRTMSDVYQDELYHPSQAMSPPHPQGRSTTEQTNLLSPYGNVFAERLETANQNHLAARSASPAMTMARQPSPFSTFPTDDFANVASNPHSPATRLNATRSSREREEMNGSVRDFQLSTVQRDGLPSNTISPKEAMLDSNEAEEAAKMPLFPQENLQKRENQFPSTNPNTRHLPRSDVDNSDTQRNYDKIQSRRRQNFSSSATHTQPGPNYTFMPPSVPPNPANTQMPQQYPFISNRRQSSSLQSASDSPVFPAPLVSMESTKSESSPPEHIRYTSDPEQSNASPPSDAQRPIDTLAGSGSYSCVTAGCSQRFDTSSKLQKHRRDSHRTTSPQPSPTTPTPSSSSTINAPGSSTSTNVNRNNQAGPHKCERINPSTNKPCNTQFSRSYDLTRHEDTIHNNRKMKVRCRLCTEEKTFSRNDALTRHMRVVHPDVDFPGKVKRRAG